MNTTLSEHRLNLNDPAGGTLATIRWIDPIGVNPRGRKVGFFDVTIQSIPRFLVVFVLLAVMAGCSGDRTRQKSTPDPISLASPEQCDVCGMVIEEHPGPSGQVYYSENRDDPVTFDSLKQGLFPQLFQRKRRGREPLAIYVTDYSRADTGIRVVDGEPYVRRAVSPESFTRADSVVFVVNSSVRGAMGKDFIPFSNRKDARQFVDEYGGHVLNFDEIKPVHTRK